jgi:hypothetical protein
MESYVNPEDRAVRCYRRTHGPGARDRVGREMREVIANQLSRMGTEVIPTFDSICVQKLSFETNNY